MSILLESLNKQSENNNSNSQVPTIHSLHFDEEMLGDDEIYRRLKNWQRFSILLILALVLSWLFFFWYQPFSKESQNQIISQIQPVEQTASTVSTLAESRNINVQNQSLEISEKLNVTATLPQNLAQQSSSVYKPVKRPKVSATTSQSLESVQEANSVALQNVTGLQENVPQDQISENKDKGQKKPLNWDNALFVEELSFELQQEFPQIAISSYVIADNEAESFVILDGAFYQPNQIISPNLILRKITAQNIFVEFHSQLVKLPVN